MILSVPFYSYILSVPFCPMPICPYTILSVYHFVHTIFVHTILSVSFCPRTQMNSKGCSCMLINHVPKIRTEHEIYVILVFQKGFDPRSLGGFELITTSKFVHGLNNSLFGCSVSIFGIFNNSDIPSSSVVVGR